MMEDRPGTSCDDCVCISTVMLHVVAWAAATTKDNQEQPENSWSETCDAKNLLLAYLPIASSSEWLKAMLKVNKLKTWLLMKSV